jgi:hypothetical protein
MTGRATPASRLSCPFTPQVVCASIQPSNVQAGANLGGGVEARADANRIVLYPWEGN